MTGNSFALLTVSESLTRWAAALDLRARAAAELVDWIESPWALPELVALLRG